ncbi:hypothetical protein FA95DRAFT_399275 [Auriscalpium vulgare]|uniref:Uncharacterized protein n=1 Tax=Auriscalpium vulgare TaxID=40419 RepID=A0ACB8RHR9_9AGAM|nr:hypothetical protein FA95DRAFT_399275 [Auriscalpium vulgare]
MGKAHPPIPLVSSCALADHADEEQSKEAAITIESADIVDLLADTVRNGSCVPTGGEPPAHFEPLEADHWVCTNVEEAIVSQDLHLAKDGGALYRFLLTQSATPPTVLLRCRGSRDETDSTPSFSSTSTVDFDFVIDLTKHVPHTATQWTVGDAEPVLRGRKLRETGAPGHTRLAGHAAVKSYRAWRERRTQRGLPPWVREPVAAGTKEKEDNGAPPRLEATKPSMTLRQWTEDFVTARHSCKEFVYEKSIYGWDVQALCRAVTAVIRATGYTGHVNVRLETRRAKIIVRPVPRLSRILGHPLVTAVSLITFMFPLVWIVRRFAERSSVQWTVAGGAYAMKRWEPVEGEAVEGAEGVVVQTPSGPKRAVGMQEREWLKMWEASIQRLVSRSVADIMPLKTPPLAATIPDFISKFVHRSS